MYIYVRGLGVRRRERVALRCRHFRTCSRAAHILGAKGSRPSCSSVHPRLHAHAHSLTHSARAHTRATSDAHAHMRVGCVCVRFVCARSACAVVLGQLPLGVRGLHDFDGVHRPRPLFETAWSEPSHKAHRPPLLRGPLLGMFTPREYSGYPV